MFCLVRLELIAFGILSDNLLHCATSASRTLYWFSGCYSKRVAQKSYKSMAGSSLSFKSVVAELMNYCFSGNVSHSHWLFNNSIICHELNGVGIVE